MSTKSSWSRDQLLVAFYLYCQMPFGKMHRGNPEIIRLSEAIGRTPSALAMKLTNIASLDPAITGSGRKGLAGASAADRAMWDEMQANWENSPSKLRQQ
jgi:putative restriction endonuclease